MKRINPYLTFNGNCRDAMTFYQTCLGGELTLQTIGNSPLANKMPDKMKDYILHSELKTPHFTIMATDCVPEKGLIKGTSISLNINCTSEAEITALYRNLSEGGQQIHALEDTFWDALFGCVTDKFGNNWMLNFDRNLVTETRKSIK